MTTVNACSTKYLWKALMISIFFFSTGLKAQEYRESLNPGFFFQFALGLGPSFIGLDSKQSQQQSVYDRVDSYFNYYTGIKLGGAVSESIALHVNLDGILIRDTIDLGLRGNWELEYRYAVWGIGIRYYILPAFVYINPNIRQGISGAASLKRPARTPFLGCGSASTSDCDNFADIEPDKIGYSLTIGKDWTPAYEGGTELIGFYLSYSVDNMKYEYNIISGRRGTVVHFQNQSIHVGFAFTHN